MFNNEFILIMLNIQAVKIDISGAHKIILSV